MIRERKQYEPLPECHPLSTQLAKLESWLSLLLQMPDRKSFLSSANLMWGWETLLFPTAGFWYFQGLLAQWSSFGWRPIGLCTSPPLAFSQNTFNYQQGNGGNLGPFSLFCSYNLGLTINSNVSPEFNSIIKIYSLGLNKVPWALEAHLNYTQIETANSLTSIWIHLLCCYLWTHEKSICLLAIPLEGKSILQQLGALQTMQRRWEEVKRQREMVGGYQEWMGNQMIQLKQNVTIT